jgi:hypothetical protein
MSNELSLSEVFSHDGVKAFGQALRFALREEDDYASLVELEYVERKEDLAEVLKKFLRRYETHARRRERENKPTFRPTTTDLESLMALADAPNVGVRPVRAAIIAHALVKPPKEEKK